jgi:hypothetical protein
VSCGVTFTPPLSTVPAPVSVYELMTNGTLLEANASGVSWIPKWRCGIVLLPLLPTSPSGSPAFTSSPT